MPKSNGEFLDPIPDENFDGAKYTIELKPSDHKCTFIKISPNEIKCNCGKGFTGPNIETLLNLFDKRK